MKSRLKDTLLLVGSESSDRSILHDVFESQYNLLEAEDSLQCILLLKQNHSCIAAVLADIPLQNEEDLRSLVQACHISETDEIPVLFLVTPAGTGQQEERAFLLGATDVVQKPYTELSIRRRVQVLVDLYMHQWHLEKMVADQNLAIRKNNQTMVDTLSAIIEHRSTESGNHVLRIRRFSQILLQEVARCCPEYQLNESIIDRISTASALHDIGKISIPDSILNKPGPLTSEEFAIMKTHTIVGAQLAEQIGDIGDPMYLRYIYNICLFHHERWDGRGYPHGLKEEDIPICAQVVGLVDVYDALTSPRVYKPAFSHEKAVNMILNGECGMFSPNLLECFKRVRADFQQLALLYADGYSPKSDDIRIPLPGPTQQNHSLTALQLSQLKYQSVLHHMNDTVIELDVGNRNYHVVYNPDPDFVSLFANSSFEELSMQLMKDGAHPDDTDSISVMQRQLGEKLFKLNQRKIAFRCQIYSHLYGEYYPYEITLLRVNTGNPNQKIVIAVFHNLENGPARITEVSSQHIDTTVFYGLTAGALCCSTDDGMSIQQGAGTLFPITGYTSQEIQSDFCGSFLRMIHPDDRKDFTAMMQNLQDLHTDLESEFRLLRKNGTPIWILGKTRCITSPDGTEIFCHLLTDITAVKEREAALIHKSSMHQSLVDMSEGVILEYDLRTQSLYCSDQWQQRFGYPLTVQEFSSKSSSASHIHPDDFPLLRAKLHDLLTSEVVCSVDLRIATSEGRYLWNRIRARAITGSDNAPIRIIAIIYDIDELKQDALAMKKQAERDGLTKLLNKASAQQQIIEYLEKRETDTKAALLAIDLDNFKQVNDTLGHLYGDAVLANVGSTLLNLFRSQDIIGRIGGDEFLILMKAIPSRELVIDRCQLLVDTFQKLLHRLMPKLPVSISVGAALVPNHGVSYSDLFQHADEALYAAKRAGKCRFHIYSPQDSYQSISENAVHTQIDSDSLPTMSSESMIRFVFHRLYESRNVEATINELLAFIGTHFNVSRVYIFENNEDNTTCSNTFEWCNEGIEPQLDFLQDLNYEEDLPGWKEVYEPTGVLYCSDVKELAPHIRAIVEPQGIKSMLHCAILDQGIFRGYVGFDECTANYLWTQEQISILQFVAEVLAVFLIKQRAKDKQ